MMVEYKIDPKESAPFLALMQEIGSERKRDGAWHVFDDPNEPGRIIETSLVRSVLEPGRRSLRVTKADPLIEEKARGFLKEPPKPSYFVASKRSRQPRRRWGFLELIFLRTGGSTSSVSEDVSAPPKLSVLPLPVIPTIADLPPPPGLRLPNYVNRRDWRSMVDDTRKTTSLVILKRLSRRNWQAIDSAQPT